MHTWNLRTFGLLRSFSPAPPALRRLQGNFTVSPNGLLLVSCGERLPFLLVYNVLTGSLLYGVRLPTYPAQVRHIPRLSVSFSAEGEGMGSLEWSHQGLEPHLVEQSTNLCCLPQAPWPLCHTPEKPCPQASSSTRAPRCRVPCRHCSCQTRALLQRCATMER